SIHKPRIIAPQLKETTYKNPGSRESRKRLSSTKVYAAASRRINSDSLYTNGDWENYHSRRSCSSFPLTVSTFDAGVLFLGKEFAACIWVEDED
ncbi:hypothetical protein, partial [Geomonas sp. Red276]